MLLTSLICLFGYSSREDLSKWSDAKIYKWFEKGEWLNGWNVEPDNSIDRKAFAISYFKDKANWDKIFTFLKDTDLTNLELKKHEIDGDNIIMAVSEYLTKDEEYVRFEAHQKYIDLQYVVEGKELMGITPLSMEEEIVVPYDPVKDVVFVTVKQYKNIKATPDRFFLFFPNDIHRPKLKDDDNSKVRKVVVKIKIN